MKRHTRSSRQSIEDAGHSTRSRTSSDDLFIPDLPKPSRSRRSTENKDAKKDATKKRQHSGGSQHRTRSQSHGSNHLSEESPAKIPRRVSSSSSKGISSKNVDRDSPKGDDIKKSKTSVKVVSPKEAQNRTPSKSEDTPQNVEHSIGNSHPRRTRKHSGKVVDQKSLTGVHDQIKSKPQKKLPLEPEISTKSDVPEPKGPISADNKRSDKTGKMGPATTPAITRPELTEGICDSHTSSRIQKDSCQKQGIEPENRVSPLGVDNKKVLDEGQPSEANDSRQSATKSMQTDQNNHSESPSNSQAAGSKDKLVEGTHKKKRHKSSSRNLAAEFSNSLKDQSVDKSKVGGISGIVSTMENIGDIKNLSSVDRVNSQDPIVPTVLSDGLATNGDQRNRTTGILPHENRGMAEASKKIVPSLETDRMDPPSSGEVQAPSHTRDKDGESLTIHHKQSTPEKIAPTKKSASSKKSAVSRKSALISDSLTSGLGNTSIEKRHEPSTSYSALDVSAKSQRGIANLASMPTPPVKATVSQKEQGSPAAIELTKGVGTSTEPSPASDVGYQAPEWSQGVSENEPFYFESDHLALKGNKDYRMLLRTLSTLEAQRKQATQDLEILVKKQKLALSEPINFVNKIQHKVDLKLPVAQRVVPLPEVNWETYLGKPENSELLQTVANQKIKTRPSNSASASNHHNCLCCKKDGTCSKSSDQPGASTSGTTSSKAKTTDPKSQTFNLPWTSDEQRRLEELLIKYPMEAVEARRWEKIAKALGNRTPLQVASRVQKYFIKLTRAGLPVPGRLPHAAQLIANRKNRRGYGFMRPGVPSTFLQSVVPPVFMNDNDSWDSFDSVYDEEDLSDEDESVPAELRETDEYKELKKLRQMRNEKIRQQAQMTHSGFQCDRCGVEPIVGTRWHCSDCPSSTSTDLCQKCMDLDDYHSIIHTSSHHLEPIRFKMEATYIDSDYTRFQQQLGSYNYLDPNYTPLNQPNS